MGSNTHSFLGKEKNPREIKNAQLLPSKLILKSRSPLLSLAHCQTFTRLELGAFGVFLDKSSPDFPSDAYSSIPLSLCTYLEKYNSVIMNTQSSVHTPFYEIKPWGIETFFHMY